ncbi:unnamed protein product [Acanthoscelides obtectus]|uniref:Mitochondrial basic amino acids transporter n=1 Tax=Acanthoscelides obtectus TaxID=200917 RepID=A0A9P0KGH4_ACAOB|nr:unnamed protein product [Acanthoscelides obtectus]CAK1624817.1 Mitochondrial basic amino acids transporter [Acanthoscelides obtectus]
MSLDFIAGWFGGVAGVLVGHPLDSVKVLLQSQDLRNPKYKGSIHCFTTLLKTDGVRGLYRGVTSPLMGVAGVNAIVFGVYGTCLRNISDPDSLKSHAMAGAAAGLLQSFVCGPVELVKSRMQVATDGCQSTYQCFKNIYKKEGVKGLNRGITLTILREVPSFASYFFVYEYLTRSENPEPPSTPRMLCAGGVAGVFTWLISYPADVLKTRMQVDSRYKSSYDCLKKSLKADGVACLFQGLTPTLIRAFPVNAVTFTVVAWTMRLLEGGIPMPKQFLEKYANVVETIHLGECEPL